LVTTRSAEVLTVVKAEALLLLGLGSVVVVVAVAVLAMVEPVATLAPTWTTMVKLGAAPAATVGLLKVMVPVPPTAGRGDGPTGRRCGGDEGGAGGDHVGEDDALCVAGSVIREGDGVGQVGAGGDGVG